MTDEPTVTERFRQYVAESAEMLARDLAALLNRAAKLGVAICPDVDDREGTSYSLEWAFGPDRPHLDVNWGGWAEGWAVAGITITNEPHWAPTRRNAEAAQPAKTTQETT